MILPQTAEYALRAMAWIALQPNGDPVRSRDLAEAVEVPPHYLSKIMRRLVLAGLVTSKRGHGGGFHLARPAEQIRFGDILDAVDAIPESGRCAFGWGTCDGTDPCPMHESWSSLQDSVRSWASSTTLADVGPLRER